MNSLLNSLEHRIFLGTGFCHSIEKQRAFKLFDKFYELGGRGIDTALIYFNAVDLLREWIEAHGIQDIVIHAKGGHHEKWSPRLDRDSLFVDVERTIERLNINKIPIFTLHRDDPDLPIDVILETIQSLVSENKILYYGTSNWRIERIKLLIKRAKELSIPLPILSSVNFSLLYPNFEMWPNVENCCSSYTSKWYIKNQYPLLAWGCMSSGFISMYRNECTPSKKILRTYNSSRNKERLKRINCLSKIIGISHEEIEWLWVCSQKMNIFPISGAQSISQLTSVFKLTSMKLTLNTCKWLNLEIEDCPSNSKLIC